MYNRLRTEEAATKRRQLYSKQKPDGLHKSFEKLDKSDVKHLFQAVKMGKTHLVRFILDATENKLRNSRDSDGRTPLIASCLLKEERTRDQLTRLLLEKKADVNLVDTDGRTALSHACEKRCNDIVSMLIQVHNIDPDKPDMDGNTPIIYCARVGNDVAIEVLVKSFRRLGLKVDHSNNEGFTALLEAARNSNVECAKILAIQGRAHKTLKDTPFNRTALEWFNFHGYERSDLSFLYANSKFVRAVKLASMLKNMSFGTTKYSNNVAHKPRPVTSDHVQEKRKLVKQRSKSLASKSRDMASFDYARRKARYQKQRSTETSVGSQGLIVTQAGPVTVTTFISTELKKLSLDDTSEVHLPESDQIAKQECYDEDVHLEPETDVHSSASKSTSLNNDEVEAFLAI